MSADDNGSGGADLVIRGSIDPGNVPYFVKYAMLVTGYERMFRGQLIQEISPRDDAILNVLATEDAMWEETEHARYSEAFLSVCANRGSKDAVTLAGETSQIASESYRRRAARYRKAIESLSPSGRQIVEDFVETVVTPGLATALPNEVELAKKSPDEFMTWFDIECHLRLTGEYPADIQKLHEQMDQENSQE